MKIAKRYLNWFKKTHENTIFIHLSTEFNFKLSKNNIGNGKYKKKEDNLKNLWKMTIKEHVIFWLITIIRMRTMTIENWDRE